jgi:hypothetical protein
MAAIVAVHGIGQQYKGDAIIHREWWPALRSGLHLAGCDLTDERELECAFYGHMFRKPGTLGSGDASRPENVDSEEAALLALLWRAAARSEPDQVPAEEDFVAGDSLARVPQLAQRALNALSKSKFWASVSQPLMVADLKQVVGYLRDPALRESILTTVLDKITSDTRVVIGHSLGSVVAYEALCRKPERVVSFVTLGSPLGIRNVIFDKLLPSPNSMQIGAWPGRVESWTNIADTGDVVALQKRLADLFGNDVKDVLVDNGSDAHHGERYLTTKQAGEAICAGLSRRNS